MPEGLAELLAEVRRLQAIEAAAKEFYRHYSRWSETPNLLPDEETLEAAGALFEALGEEVSGEGEGNGS